MGKEQSRPIYLNLPKLASRMSITAKISILHRASGVLLFLALPFILYLFHRSLIDPVFYANIALFGSLTISKIIYLVLVWALMHHLCAGIRFVLLDLHLGIEKMTAQKTARLVLVASLLFTIIIGVLIW